jgi:hypothetical protein
VPYLPEEEDFPEYSALVAATKKPPQGARRDPVGSSTLTCGTAPSAPAESKKPGDLTVIVLDASTGRPIRGAKVSINGPKDAQKDCDRTGAAQFRGIPKGDYEIEATFRGYAQESAKQYVPPASSTQANLSLQPLTVVITEVGFSGGNFFMTKWSDDAAQRTTIINPVWTADGARLPACYKKGWNAMKLDARVLIFPKPTQKESLSLRAEIADPAIRFKKNKIPISAGATEAFVSDVLVTSGALVKQVGILTVQVSWSYSWDDGASWEFANATGLHRIYVVHDKPLESPLFDLALEKACNYANKETTADGAAGKINQGIPGELKYDPGFLAAGHVLGYFAQTRCLCMNNAALMAYLCRSVGVAATMLYIWGGVSAKEQTMFSFRKRRNSFRVLVGAKDSASLNPHFTYHVQTHAGSKDYDPSYGNVGLISLDETAPGASRRTKSANVVSGEPGGWPPWSSSTDSGWTCPHTS